MTDPKRAREQILEFIRKLPSVDTSIDIESVEGLLSNEIIDSLGFIQLVFFMEKTFAVSISQEDLIVENFDTINSIVEYIESVYGS